MAATLLAIVGRVNDGKGTRSSTSCYTNSTPPVGQAFTVEVTGPKGEHNQYGPIPYCAGTGPV